MTIPASFPRRISRVASVTAPPPDGPVARLSALLAAGIGHPPRLPRTGQVVVGGRVWDAEREGLPPGTHTELLAEASGLLQGRFLLTPGPRTQLTLEQRLVAVARADQAAAALASGRLASRR